jgi:hypothetical protein
MTAATYTLNLRTRVNWRRFEHMKKHAVAVVRRAPKRERKALVDRFARQMAESCVHVSVEK